MRSQALKPLASLSTIRLYSIRFNSTITPPLHPVQPTQPDQPSSASPTQRKVPISPTTFSEKSSPRDVHERPELWRGIPPRGTGPSWAKSSPASTSSVGVASSVEGREFDGPSRPRLLYDRPGNRDLPKLKNRIPLYIGIVALGLSAWGGFLLYATNAERLASSVMRSVTFQLRHHTEVAKLLGDNVKLETPWWGGDPWVAGSVNTMQGRVDLKFRITGTTDAGTIYFTSIRPSQADDWRIVRYKLIADSGEVLRLENTAA